MAGDKLVVLLLQCNIIHYHKSVEYRKIKLST